MTAANAALRAIVDLMLQPLARLPPIVALIAVSALAAIAMLVVVKHTSNQRRLAEVKRRIHAGLFEIRLYNDDLRAILRAQLEILRHNATYLWLSLPPMLVLIVPFVLAIAQLQFHFGYRGLSPGESALVKVELRPDAARGQTRPELSLSVPAGVRVEAAAVWIPSLGEMTWRIVAERPGAYQVEVALGGQTYAKSLSVSQRLERRSPVRVEPGLWRQVLYPAEDPLPAGAPIRAIHVSYADAEVDALGLRMHWLVAFFVLSISFAFLLRGAFGVTI